MKVYIFFILSLIIVLTHSMRVQAYNGNDYKRLNNNNLRTNSYKKIRTQDLILLLRSKPGVVIIDVRPEDMTDGKRLPGAKMLAHDAKEDEIEAVLPNKDATVIVYCENEECPQSQYLVETLTSLGYHNVLKYVDGIEGWERSGQSTETTRSAHKSETRKSELTDPSSTSRK